MANTYEKYETDATAEAEGVWVAIDDDVRVKIAAFGNPKHDRALRRLRKPYLRCRSNWYWRRDRSG